MGLVIVLIDRDPEFLRIDAKFNGKKIPGETDGFFLEIVAEGKVAEHFEKGMVPGGVSDIFQIVVLAAGPDTPLTGNCPHIITFLLTHKHGLELHHACIGKEQRRVVFGDER
ncbi:MAG: hypothetical protein ACD_75C01413G0001 [uncultured bacterium]|nr:MAG: hypothetical protein ACD_75C01413G0001 [uncultured bacterium]